MKAQDRDELLIRLDERTERLEKWTLTHVALHEKLSMAFVGAVVSTILALFAAVVSSL
jgi:ABC-type phosphate/phosphonate transport system permease subunit